MRNQEMMNRLQPFMRRSAIYKAIFDVEAKQFENRDTVIEDLQLQLSVDTATWALEIYEKELGILTNKQKTLAERRSVIKSKMIGTGKVDIKLIQLVAESFENGRVGVQYGPLRYSYDTVREEIFNPPYPIVISFVDARGIPPNIEDLKDIIEEIKPCHIRVEYRYRYMTWDELEAVNTTWDGLDAKRVTWDQFETGSWIG